MSYKTIKFNYPEWWGDIAGVFSDMIPSKDGVWGDYRFFINDPKVKECDYWFVCEDHSIYLFEKVKCPPENCIFISNEAESMWQYPQDYLNQFGRVISSRADITHADLDKNQHICFWHVKKSYQELKNIVCPDKKDDLSAVISNAFSLEGHRKRYKLMNRLQGHFKDKLQWFGKGENPIDDKWDGIAPFKYSLALENSQHWGYFTEKLMDCYLSHTMPIYWGCPNILDYFPAESMVLIDDLDDYKTVIKQIEQAIEENLFEKNFAAIQQARELILDKYQIFAYLKDWLDQDTKKGTGKASQNLIKEKSFFTKTYTLKQKLYYFYKRYLLS